MDSNLLKEAIADAKAVRATALANAKVALEEAFQPRFHAMFAGKLKEEAGMVEPDNGSAEIPPVTEEEQVSEAEIDSLIKELEAEVGGGDEAPPSPDFGGGDEAPPMDATQTEEPPMGGEGEPLKAGDTVVLQKVPAGPEMGGEEMPPTPPTPPMGGEEMPPMGGGAGEEEMDEEVDLNELLESLKEEAEEEEAVNESVPVNTSGIGGNKAGGADNKEPSADASKTSHIETSGQSVKSATVGTPEYCKKTNDATDATRPNQAKNATKDNLSTPGGALKENNGGATPGYPEGAKKTSSGKDPAEVSNTPNAGPVTPDKMDTPKLTKENVELRKQLGEAHNTIAYIKGQLNEINLLNAKLLYTNKLFKEFAMSNEQKMRVVEMFDLSKNVREVKLTYATIAESLNFSGDMKKKLTASASVQSITEGIASKPVGSTKPSKNIINEGNKFASRMKQLAGIRSEVK